MLTVQEPQKENKCPNEHQFPYFDFGFLNSAAINNSPSSYILDPFQHLSYFS